MTSKIFHVIFGLMIVFTCKISNSQVDARFDVVFVSDTLVASARVGKLLVDGRFTLVEDRRHTVMEGGQLRDSSVLTYAVDCKAPFGIALVRSLYNIEREANAEPRWGTKVEKGFESGVEFKDVKFLKMEAFNSADRKLIEGLLGKASPAVWPNITELIVTYACRATSTGSSGLVVSAELKKTGGVANLKELTCEIFASNNESDSFSFRFSEELGFVQANNTWKAKPFVNEQSLGFTSATGAVTRIDRKSGKLTMSNASGDTFATGLCDLSQNVPKKF